MRTEPNTTFVHVLCPRGNQTHLCSAAARFSVVLPTLFVWDPAFPIFVSNIHPKYTHTQAITQKRAHKTRPKKKGRPIKFASIIMISATRAFWQSALKMSGRRQWSCGLWVYMVNGFVPNLIGSHRFKWLL